MAEDAADKVYLQRLEGQITPGLAMAMAEDPPETIGELDRLIEFWTEGRLG